LAISDYQTGWSKLLRSWISVLRSRMLRWHFVGNLGWKLSP